jgi:hypothetical protein
MNAEGTEVQNDVQPDANGATNESGEENTSTPAPEINDNN